MCMKSLFAQSIPHMSAAKSVSCALALCVGALLLAGCGFMSGPEPTPTPTRPMFAPVPTFTPAPPSAPAAQESGGGAATVQQTAPTAVPVQAVQPADTPMPTDTPAPEQNVARFTVKTDLEAPAVNVRTGPGIGFGIIGTVPRGAQFDISGRNVENTWYEFCCLSGQPGWIFSGLVNVENAHLITIAQNIPNTPVPPTPVPAPTAAPAVQAPADPCAGIGGDGCKFWLRNQDFKNNGGKELKLFVGFVHEGRSDEVQGVGGSYFVELQKDGAHVSAVDHSTRGGNATHQGPQGNKYNYLKIVPLNQVPGGNVAGNYTIWVKDGNGERDSRNFTFTVSGGNGEVWLIFAQNN